MEAEIRIKKRLGDFLLETDISGDIRRLGILGESGCGKSLTLRCISGIEKPDEGIIRIGDRVLFDSGKGIDLKSRHRRTGYLFQSYALFPNMTVTENISAGIKGSGREKQKKAEEMIETFRLQGLEKHLPRQLSGGQQQRVALARLLAAEPEVILLDEPFSALDAFLKDTLIQEMDEYLGLNSLPVILVSHSRDEVYRLCDRTAVMDRGRVLVSGPTCEVFSAPLYARAAALTGCKNILEAVRKDDHTLYLPVWEVILSFPGVIPADCRYAGIRAHDLIPVYDEPGEDCLRVGKFYEARVQFERQYYISPGRGQVPESGRLRFFVQREYAERIDKDGMPEYLRIPAEKVMLLK